MTDAVFDSLSAATYQRSPLHAQDRDWPETNCYLDIWIELLPSLGLPPEACLAYSITQDFEGDQFTFFKVPLEDLEALYGLKVTELAIYDRVENHIQQQIERGRASLVEVDSYFLPDTHGIGYHQAHGKTTIVANWMDFENRTMEYFHGLGLHRLEGDDFDGIFQRGDHAKPTPFLPYTEFVKFPKDAPALSYILAVSEELLRHHLKRRPAANPVAAFAKVFPAQVEKVSEREFDFFHLYAFNTLRQLGANFELFSSYLEWLVAQGRPELEEGVVLAKSISSTAKMVQFKLARAVMRKKFQGLEEGLVPAVEAWDNLMALLDRQYGGAQPSRISAVPGTVAAALAEAGRFDPDNPVPLHGKDVWYEGWFDADPGDYRLCLDGLATIAEVYLNDVLVLESRNMFRCHEAPVALVARNTLKLCFRALSPHLEAKGPRARWKPQLATSQGLRLVRTTLLGHMPGWCPEIHAVGPYRPIRLEPVEMPRVAERQIQADLAPDGAAVLTVALRLENIVATPVLSCAGSSVEMTLRDDGTYLATLRPETIAPWMPHTHGTPSLYEISVRTGDQVFSLGKTGFRRVETDQGADGKGFGVKVNGVPVFCRGAVWTSADILTLAGDAETYRGLLEQARDAGMNMLRIGGTMLYETRAFFELCDELGILVWQDFQFANYDYPVKDDAFVAEIEAEIRDQLGVSMGCPSLAVLCGGSEIYQQGAMMGLPESRWQGPLSEEILPDLAKRSRPDVPYVPNSPHGGTLPFSPNEGVAHYYGVGAYLRPLEDARRADVRFAGECLAFSNIPSEESLTKGLPVKPGHDPRWKARVPRDRGAGWDFEDVRDHYLKALYGIDPADLRNGDPDRYLDLGRAVTGDVMERTFAEWRRPGSSCQGALVWTFQDLALGAGWGVVDAEGQPKPAYYALKRAFRPLQVSVTDEGTNGLAIHVINDGPEEAAVTLSLSCLRDGQVPVVTGKTDLTLAPHAAKTLNAVDLIGVFFDVTYAYRFGPLSHDVTVVQMTDQASGDLVADAFHRTGGELAPTHFDLPDFELRPGQDGNWWLEVTAKRFLQSVSLSLPGYVPDDNWFHLAPGGVKRINTYPLDLPHFEATLAHKMRVFGSQVDRTIVTVDVRPPQSGRYKGDPKANRYMQSLETFRALYPILESRYENLSFHEVDYSAAEKKSVSDYFLGSEEMPDKAWDGGPFYCYFQGILDADSDYVLHMDADMLYGGMSQTWVDEAISLLQERDDLLFASPLPGPPHPEGLKGKHEGADHAFDGDDVDGRVAYRFHFVSTRIFLMDMQRFKERVGTLDLETPPLSYRLRGLLLGNPIKALSAEQPCPD
eukprot:g950.t1